MLLLFVVAVTALLLSGRRVTCGSSLTHINIIAVVDVNVSCCCYRVAVCVWLLLLWLTVCVGLAPSQLCSFAAASASAAADCCVHHSYVIQELEMSCC